MVEAGCSLVEALQSLHGDLVTMTERSKDERIDVAEVIGPQLGLLEDKFKALLDRPRRNDKSRNSLMSHKITIEGEEYNVSKQFEEIALQVADEIDLDELEASKLVLESERDEYILGRSLRECAIIRFHQQRSYLLNCIRLMLKLSKPEELPAEVEEWFTDNVNDLILGGGPSTKTPKLVPRCMAAMNDIRVWLQQIADYVAGATVLGSASLPEFRETIEFSRASLIQQHEVLAVILCQAIGLRAATPKDFTDFITGFRKAERYDFSTAHLFPVLGVFITAFGSTEGSSDLETARRLNAVVCDQSDDDSRFLPYLQAVIRAWWLAEYSGWYLDNAAGSTMPGIDIDAEDKQRSKQFTEALKDGAFDVMLGIIADVKSSDWQDPTRIGIRQWLQRKSPPLPLDAITFSDFFQTVLMNQMEVFIDAFISNLPDILRKLRAEEDEQRQINQAHEQDLDLERFLLIIAYVYEGRPEAADAFWEDPESNLAGFLQWASKRASTPLVSAFCEMLQSLSEDPESATSAHEFLLEDGYHASGKMRKNMSLTWSQIFKELEFFTNKIREKPTAAPAHVYKSSKFNNEQAETEPESAMMLQCYLRLIAKLASQSDAPRIFVLEHDDGKMAILLFQLISSMVPSRLRACAFNALGSLLARKNIVQSRALWQYLDSCLSGAFMPISKQQTTPTPTPTPSYYMEALFEEIGKEIDEASSFIQFLTALSYLPSQYGLLNDALPFPEDLGVSTRMRPGIEPYIDFTLGHVFASKSEGVGFSLQRMLRYNCLEFALTCLSTFNEDLIVFGNETNIPIDSVISTTDLKTYVSLHPFARVMEWMYDSHFTKAVMGTIHQDAAEVGAAAPDSPLILSILRGIEVISKVLDLQATYLDLVRPIVKPHARPPSRSIYTPVSNGAYGSIEDGLLTNLTLVADLVSYCGIGITDLTLASLKLLEKISTSSKIVSAWQTGPSHQVRRNKAIIVLEDNGADSLAGPLISEMNAQLDPHRKTESANYQTKVHILDFLYSCIRANPGRPTVAHLLLGFQCGTETLSIGAGSLFDKGESLFHALLCIPAELPVKDDEGVMRQWLINLKFKAMRVFRELWSSPLSASIVLEQLRENDLLFHILLQELVLLPSTLWDELEPLGPDFLVSPAAEGYANYLSLRAMALEYITHELCNVSQSHLPALKRRIFEALSGQVTVDGGNAIPVVSIFEFNDFLPHEEQFATAPPEFTAYRDLDLRVCLDEDANGIPTYNLGKVQELLLLKRNHQTRISGQIVQSRAPGQIVPHVPQQDLTLIEMEEEQVQIYAAYLNRIAQVNSYSLSVLDAWAKLLMVMAESNDFKGTNKMTFILQALQAILPSLEMFGSDNPGAAYKLAKLAKVLLFNLEFKSMASADKNNRTIGSVVSDKLFQLFQICLDAIAKWAGNPELRTIYYGICYRYITALIDHGKGLLAGRQKAAKTIQVFGERLMNVMCDDAYCGDAACQAAALILLGTLVNLGRQENDNFIVDTLNRLNFIGVVVDSLRNLLNEWVEATGNTDQEHYQDAKLVLLLQLCQTRDGAKNVLHANLFRSIELSGLFAADPELQVDSSDSKALEKHYALLVKITRIIGAAIVSRGSQNVLQGRRFLTEHRMLVMHVLKRSAGIGTGVGRMDAALEERIQDLAEAFMVIIMATGFVEYESEVSAAPAEQRNRTPILFH